MKNELWDSHMFVETAVAERRTAGIWCGVERSRMVEGHDGPDG